MKERDTSAGWIYLEVIHGIPALDPAGTHPGKIPGQAGNQYQILEGKGWSAQ